MTVSQLFAARLARTLAIGACAAAAVGVAAPAAEADPPPPSVYRCATGTPSYYTNLRMGTDVALPSHVNTGDAFTVRLSPQQAVLAGLAKRADYNLRSWQDTDVRWQIKGNARITAVRLLGDTSGVGAGSSRVWVEGGNWVTMHIGGKIKVGAEFQLPPVEVDAVATGPGGGHITVEIPRDHSLETTANLAADADGPGFDLPMSCDAPPVTLGSATVDDPASANQVSIHDAEVGAPRSGVAAMRFTVGLSAPRATDVIVHFATSDGTAIAGQDYWATDGTVRIPAGATSATIMVGVPSTATGGRTFYVSIDSPVNAIVGTATATGIIDEPAVA